MAKSLRLQFSDAHLSFYCWLIQVICLLFLLSILIWKCLTPQPPIYTIIDVAFSNKNLTSVVLDLKISNPNQGFRVYYNHTSVSLEGSVVGNGSVSDFDHSGYGETSFRRVVVNGTRKGALDVVKLRLVVGVEFEDKVVAMRTKRKEMVYEAVLRVGVDGKIEGGKEVVMVRNKGKVRREGDGEVSSSYDVKTSRKFRTFGILGSDHKNL